MNKSQAGQKIGATLLLVDDDRNVTAALERLLCQEGYRMLTAESADAAMDILATQRIDIVITDERMPGMSGSELLTEVRKRYPSTVRIILSGQASLESAVRAINEGEIYRFLLKPCNPDELKIAIRQGLEQRRLLEQNRWLLNEYRRQSDVLKQMDVTERVMQLRTDEDGAILLDDEGDDDGTGVDSLLSEIEKELMRDERY